MYKKQLRSLTWIKRLILLFGILVGSFLSGEFSVIMANKLNGSDGTESQQQQNQIVVNGTVADSNGEPLIGVGVFIEGTTLGVITDIDGNFSLSAPSESSVLVFSFIGYERESVKIGAQRVFNIVLEDSSISLDDIVVIGYGTQRKVSSTASLSTIDNKSLMEAPTANVANSLTGRVSGLTSIQQSGLPGGDKPILRVRGITTLDGGFVAEPLVLVDGIERPFDQLDPNEIESVTVLKDASATAVFGVKGANGVIIVTTKRGEKGKAVVSVSSNFSVSTPVNVPDMLTSASYAERFNESKLNDGTAGQFKQWQIDSYRYGMDPVLYPSIDWFDYMMKDFSWQTQHNFNIRGGTDKVKYFTSVSYLHQDGLWETFQTDYNNNNTFDRFNFRSNFDINLTRSTTLAVNIGSRVELRNSPNTNMNDYFGWVYTSPPNTSAGIVDDKLILTNTVLGPKREPFSRIARSGFAKSLSSSMDLKVVLDQKLDFITKGLSASTTFSYDSYYSFRETQAASIPAYYVDRNIADIDEDGTDDAYIKYYRSGLKGPLSYSTGYGKERRMYVDGRLSYNRTFSDVHDVSALYLFNADKLWFPDANTIGMPEIPRSYLGMVGRLTYGFKDKYLSEVNFGYNGSENFPKDDGKRYGFFPSFSLGYVVSEEAWMKWMTPLSFLKLKASYGFVGNDKVRQQRFLYSPAVWNPVNNGNNNAWFGQDPKSYSVVQLGLVGNPDVTWEVALKRNLAFESKWLNSRIALSADYFWEDRDKILTQRQSVPAHVAASFKPSNIGQVESWGYEIEAGWNDRIGNGFSYFIKGNYSFNRNKVVYKDEVLRDEPWLNETGYRVGQYRGLIAIGLVTEPEQLTDPDLPTYTTGGKLQLGDILYKDFNEDGIIDADDVVPVGYSQWPEITYGISSGFDYRGFNFSFLLQGTDNVSNYYSGDVRTPFNNDGSIFSYHNGRWTPETSETATYPRLTGDNKHSNYVGYGNVSSTYWLKDASYIRLKNIEVGYAFGTSGLKRIGVSKLRVFANANNVYTWSKLKIFDPESTPGGPYRYPQLTTYNLGLNINF